MLFDKGRTVSVPKSLSYRRFFAKNDDSNGYRYKMSLRLKVDNLICKHSLKLQGFD